MSEAPSPAGNATPPGSFLIDASPLPAKAMKTPGGWIGDVAVRHVHPDCLALTPTPRARLCIALAALIPSGFLVGVGLIVLALAWLLVELIEDDPSCVGRTWERWILDGVLALFVFPTGVMGAGLVFPLRRMSCAAGAKQSKGELIHWIVVAGVMPVASLLVFAWEWDRSSLAIRLLGLPLCSVIATLAMLGIMLVLFTPLAYLLSLVQPRRILCDRQGEAVFDDALLDFPKALCKIEEIAAVQVVKGEEPASPDGSLSQVNLALGDPNKPRVGLAQCSAPAQAREVGQTLADFLGVPLVVSG